MQNGNAMDYEKRLAELEAEKQKALEMLRGLEAETNKIIAAANEQGQSLQRTVTRLEGAIAFIKVEVLGSGPPQESEARISDAKALVEVVAS